jgi:hypothetical protein
VIAFDAVAGGKLAHRRTVVPVPAWLADEEGAWAGIPLLHSDHLVGLVVLKHPYVRRPLDWEDYDLFRTAGIQAASYLAEAQSQEALANAQRFDEFNRRFAFIMHDIKNLVSQLSLVARNAERHAENPGFPRRHDRDPAEFGEEDERSARPAQPRQGQRAGTRSSRLAPADPRRGRRGQAAAPPDRTVR